ncbi:MAG TPA: L-lactate permease [Vicinamibacterales bacterium]|nr:L-lactate permease [Vicinamibacterales bacterium]
MTWTQLYDPFGHWWLSSLVAAIPLVVLFGLLVAGKVKPAVAAGAGALIALTIATTVFTMPVRLAGLSFLYGIANGLKIAWIVVAAVYLYDLSVHTGQFEIMKQSIARITPDRRLQVLLVAFCFGAFLEGAAGFGSPVAIAGAFMIGLGFSPFHAATLNLIANTAPVAWGAIGTPVHMLAFVTALPEPQLNAMIGRILPFAAVIVPFWLVRIMVGWAETVEVLPAILTVGLSFATTQFVWSNYVDANLVDIASGVVSLIAALVLLRFWQPKRIWRLASDEAEAQPGAAVPHKHRGREIARAWMPFALLTLCVLLWGMPPVKKAMDRYTEPSVSQGGWNFPGLHRAVQRDQPVVAKLTPEGAKYEFNWLSMTGTSVFIAAVLSGFLLGLGPGEQFRLFLKTVLRMRHAGNAICLMLGLGFITRYSGMDGVLAIAFTRTGVLFPFFGTFLGWLGVALTGSDTASNALFGGMQRITAEQLNLSPILMGAANSAGGVMGKMVDAQSIVVATAATNQVGNEGRILRYVFWHSIALAAIVGVIVTLYAYVFTAAVPK